MVVPFRFLAVEMVLLRGTKHHPALELELELEPVLNDAPELLVGVDAWAALPDELPLESNGPIWAIIDDSLCSLLMARVML